ncbi:MAG TPA: molybdopterin-synthase adenylyltransferase MoeB [Longimicrobiales bacterium]|nr:molybdopterin-synthase adenylyltransferase MoeB [Longimicrobiales bacterium]
MSAVVHLPLALRAEAGGAERIDVDCATVADALASLSARHPTLRRHLFDETGRLRRHVNVFLNDEELRALDGPATRVAPGDRIQIVPSIAGGQESAEDLARYARQISLPELGVEGQRRLASARVLVVGAGGLGSPAALYLVAAGVGTVGLVDFDRVDVTNLHRQILYGDAEVGRAKIDAAVARLRALNRDVNVVGHEMRLDSSNALDVMAGYDVVIDGSDNFPTRYLVNDACVLLKKPFAYGAILRFEGQASLFGAPDGPCYRCLFREPPPPGLVPSCAEAGVIGVLPGVIGSLQALEAIKWLTGAGTSLAGRLLIFDALAMRWRELRLKRDPECPACGDAPSIDRLIDYEEFCGLKRAMNTGVEDISATQLKAELERKPDLVLIDVREPYELDIASFRPYSVVHIPLADIPARLDELSPDSDIVVACRSGSRSGHAARYLRDAGFTHVRNLAGGIGAWSDEVDPTVPKY